MKPGGLFVYNGDEPLIPRVLNEADTHKPDRLRTVTFGLGQGNDEYPTGMMFMEDRTLFTSRGTGGEPLGCLCWASTTW